MIEELLGAIVFVATNTAITKADVAVEKAAKKHRWVRVLQMLASLAVVVLCVGLIYVIVRYS